MQCGDSYRWGEGGATMNLATEVVLLDGEGKGGEVGEGRGSYRDFSHFSLV